MNFEKDYLSMRFWWGIGLAGWWCEMEFRIHPIQIPTCLLRISSYSHRHPFEKYCALSLYVCFIYLPDITSARIMVKVEKTHSVGGCDVVETGTSQSDRKSWKHSPTKHHFYTQNHRIKYISSDRHSSGCVLDWSAK